MGRLRAYLSVIWKIFARDLKRILRNPVAVVVLSGLCLLPSLYAWYIVAANWDPYQNTDNLKVAVVDQDEGADSQYVGHVDVGEQVVASLKDNHDMGWEFVDADEAQQRVSSGEYFAAIVMPKDFSSRFLSVFDGDFQRPQIEYYVNEKLSGSGAKIVDAAAREVQEAVNRQFVSTVSDHALSESQKVAEEVGADEASAEASLSDSISAAGASIGDTRERIDRLRGTVQGIQVQGHGDLGELHGSVADYLRTAKEQVAAVADASDALIESAQQTLGDAASTLDMLQSSSAYSDLKSFLNLDDAQVADFMAQPVQLSVQKVYPVANYGSGVAPFFTNLALWVSSILVLALMHVRVDRKGLPPFTDVQGYFGRWLLLMAVCLVQSTIVCAGDLVMGIQCESPPAFMGAGILSGIVYANLMFALSYSMRHVGKALSIILLIVQIPGSSGMFPIQMMPAFFQVLNPLLPFTYSIDAMREAIGGFYGMDYLADMLVLGLVFLPVGFLIGLGLGKCSFNLNVMFDKKLAEGGLFSTEEVLGGAERMRFRSMLVALMRTPEYRARIRARARRFDRRYGRLVAVGWVALLAMPAAMFCVLALVHGGVDTTLLLLTLFIVGVLVVVAYLVSITYLDMSIASQLKLSQGEGVGSQGHGPRRKTPRASRHGLRALAKRDAGKRRL